MRLDLTLLSSKIKFYLFQLRIKDFPLQLRDTFMVSNRIFTEQNGGPKHSEMLGAILLQAKMDSQIFINSASSLTITLNMTLSLPLLFQWAINL